MSELTDKDIEERNEFRKMVKDTHLVVCGNKELKIPGMIDKHEETIVRLGEIDNKLDRDHALLWPNRVLFFIGKTLRKPAVLIVFFLIVASFFGISNVDAIKMFLGIGQ